MEVENYIYKEQSPFILLILYLSPFPPLLPLGQ